MVASPVKISAETRHLPALTGLRAVAAYLVFLHHYNPISNTTATGWLYRLFDQGYIGVSIFFTLSGFLIYHRYAERYFKAEKWSWKTYYQNRFARVVPLYCLVLLPTFGGTITRNGSIHWLELVLNLTLTKGFFEEYKFSGIPQSWSLTVEIGFYLIAPLLFSVLRRRGPLVLTALLLCAGLSLWLTVGRLNGHGFFDNLSFLLFYTFPGRSFDFVPGMWIAQQWHRGRLPRVRYATAKSLFTIAFCVSGQVFITSWTGSSNTLILNELTLYNFGLPIGLGLLLLGLVQEKSGLQRLLAHPLAQSLGRSSYAFYLIHIGVISKLIQRAMPEISVGILFIVLILVSQGLYTWIEKPLQQRFRAAS